MVNKGGVGEDIFLPKFLIKKADINLEIDLMYRFSKNKNNRFINVFNKIYPDLLLSLEQVKGNKNEEMRVCKEFLEKTRISEKEKIEAAENELKKSWDMVGNNFLMTLSKILETNWPEDKPEISAYISVLPISPRFLKKQSFFLAYKNCASLLETTAHEIVHFLWFKKWKEVFPEMGPEQYESPNLAWRLSEIMDPIILHCNPEINNLISPARWGYSSFKTIKINGVEMIGYFKNIYLDCIDNGLDFKSIMEKLWKEARIHEVEISNF